MISIVGPVRRKALGLGVVCGVVLAGGAGFVVLGPEPSSSAAAPAVEASIADWRWAPRDELPAAPKAKDEEPEPVEEEPVAAEEQAPERDPKPTAPATSRAAKPDDLPSLPDAASSAGDNVLIRAEVL